MSPHKANSEHGASLYFFGALAMVLVALMIAGYVRWPWALVLGLVAVAVPPVGLFVFDLVLCLVFLSMRVRDVWQRPKGSDDPPQEPNKAWTVDTRLF